MTMTSDIGFVHVDDSLESEAGYTVSQITKAWTFLWPEGSPELPEELDVAVRAMLLQGAVGTEILGALLIAAQRPQLDNHWAYTRGIVRNNIAIACRDAAERRRSALEASQRPEEMSWASDPQPRNKRPWWKSWGKLQE